VHVLTPFVALLATGEQQKKGIISAQVLNRTSADLQRRYRKKWG